jgi:hypothetical protein
MLGMPIDQTAVGGVGEMIETNREQGTGIIPGTVLMSAFVRQTELWTNAQSEVLSFAETAIAGRMNRWREAVDTWSRSFQKLCDCRNPVDCAHTLQDWLRDTVRIATSDMRALADDSGILAGWTSAALRVGEVAGTHHERPEAGESRVEERLAAE